MSGDNQARLDTPIHEPQIVRSDLLYNTILVTRILISAACCDNLAPTEVAMKKQGGVGPSNGVRGADAVQHCPLALEPTVTLNEAKGIFNVASTLRSSRYIVRSERRR